jgi:hypothetical protein
MGRKNRVERPQRKSEFSIFFGSSHARKGWNDLLAGRRSDLVEAWEYLTHRPQEVTALSHPLRGSLSTVVREGVSHTRWQLKLSKTHGARIWYYVDGSSVNLEKVHTSHPVDTL